MSYLSLIMSIFKVLSWLIETGQRWKWMEEGANQVIAKAMTETMRKAGYAKQALAEFTGMPKSAVDDFLRGLEPGSDGDGQPVSGLLTAVPKEGRQQDNRPAVS